MSADFWAGYVSGAVGILVGNPLDLAKVRLQAEPIGSPLRRASQLAATTSRSALLAGSPGPLLGYGALNAILFVAYNRSEHILNRLLAPNPPPRATSTGVNLWTTWLAGAVGGLATWVISTPTELVKCRAQLATGSPSSSALSSYSIAHGILRTEGISGLYHGGVITASRDSIGYGFYFWAYEFSKRAITAKNLGSRSRETINTLLCGGIAGVATWASIFPLDVIKTRVQGQVFDGSQKKKGAREIARETYKEGGPRIFVRGLAVCSLRAFVVNAVQWAVYEWAMVHLQKPEQLEVHDKTMHPAIHEEIALWQPTNTIAMASFLRGKQAGMQNDLSANILPGLFAPDDRARYGISSQISCLAFEPVQSLIAVGTNESRFGPGKIYVFGQSRVKKNLLPPRSCSFEALQFCANRLISLDTKNEVVVWDLDKGQSVAAFHAPGNVVCMLTDPMLDWCFLGLHTGEIFAYDLDRQRMSNFRLPNFWTDRDPRARAVALVSLQLHPRDVGKLLIGYTHGAVIYSFKQNQPSRFYEYQIPPGAPGGSHQAVDSLRKPKLTHALWHPTGTFVLTAHDDASLCFWDTTKDGRLVMARTLSDFNVDQPSPKVETTAPQNTYLKILWCCKQNPEDSALLIAGGQSVDEPNNGLTFIDFGITPNYATSSWQILSDYLRGRCRSSLEIPAGAEIVNFFLIPRVSPHFAGAQDPIAVMVLLSSGEMITMSFPSGYPISPTNQFHPSLSLVQPFATKLAVTTLGRERWLGMVENRNQGEPILKGGAEAALPRRRFEGRTIIQVAHADSTVRIWDVGHGDEIENSAQLQVDVARALNRFDDVNITAMSMALDTGEFAVGTSKGEVVIWRWDTNKYYGKSVSQEMQSNPGGLSDISSRSEPNLKSGLQPSTLYEMMQGPITAVKMSNVGFVAIGSEVGFMSLLDLRGPSVMFHSAVADLTKPEKKSFLKGRSNAPPNARDWPVVIEFGVMTLDEDKYSSICCFIGTNAGKVITLKLLPSGAGFQAQLAGISQLDDCIVSISPIVNDTGKPASATGHTVAGLRSGQHVTGSLIVVTKSEIRIFRPATAKGASKSFGDYMCTAATVTEFELHGMALVGVFGDRTTRAFSLPGLKELGGASLSMMDGSRTSDSLVTEDGEVFCWTSPSEFAVLQVWGTGKALENTSDKLINPDLILPPRPTISNMQWISGTQYVSPADLDLLIGGPGRPPSKRMVAATAAMEQEARAGGPWAARQEGWGDYLTRQLNERAEKLNIMGDGMDNMAESSQRWAEDASKFVSQQKRKILWGGITNKFS